MAKRAVKKDAGPNPDPANTRPGSEEFIIVGIGASAGGIEATREFFQHVAEDSGMAYVVILHLSPEHDSQLASVLQQTAKIRVTQVTEQVKVQPNQVYVISPNRHLEMQDGNITVTLNTTFEERRAPIDIFFRTLAESHGSNAVAVILSGTGANGSMGIKRIKEKGGAAFVQSPAEAQYSEMPLNSLDTGLIDDALPVAAIPGRIAVYKKNSATVQIKPEPKDRSDEQQQALREIFTQLRIRTGHDFSNYKTPTLLRRIERRMSVRNIAKLSAYSLFIREQPDETQALLKDLLISVTNFFRDARAFEHIEREVLPDIIKGKTSEDQIRIWTSGCATGEEAYSLAILCMEILSDMPDAPQVQIFATDIDETALRTARDGIYTLNDAADVSPERLRRFFTRQGDNYRIRDEVREKILFAHHNILKDPPFSHLHLASCRNLMIYLNQTAQERVMSTLHFALNPEGYLFLGGSESADSAGDLYVPVSRENHVYKSRQVVTRINPSTDSYSSFQFQPRERTAAQESESRMLDRISFGDLHQQLLEQYAPPSVVINENYDILHLSQQAGRYMQVAGGEPSKNLLKLILPELRLDLRSALYTAVQQRRNAETKALYVRTGEREETIRIEVRPVLRAGDTARGFLLVVFEPEKQSKGKEAPLVFSTDEPIVRQLEDDLVRTKEQLRISNEQHEVQAEDLRAVNEELQALNEELRSAAEELETSKEELQSINEELRTVNQELKIKIEELTHSGNKLQNLINSTNIGTIFLDRSFRVVLFTPAAQKIFNLIQGDIGRPLSDITSKLTGDGLLADAETVLEKLQLIEREVQTQDDKYYSMRLLPYRTAEDRINGVVITFVDITERRKVSEAFAASERKYSSLFDSIDEGFAIIEVLFDDKGKAVDYRFLEVNPAFVQQTELQNTTGKTVRSVMPGLEELWFEAYGEVATTGESKRFEYFTGEVGGGVWYDVYAFRVDEPERHHVAVLFNDVTGRKRRELAGAFVNKVSQDLAMLATPEDIMKTVGERIGDFLQVSACLFNEIDEKKNEATVPYAWMAPGTPDLRQTFRLDEYLAEEFNDTNRTGEAFVVNNTATDDRTDTKAYARLKMGAFVTVPFHWQGRWAGYISVTSTQPRVWKEDEIALLQEISDRLFFRIERARAEAALQKSEEKYRTLFDSIDEGFCLIEIVRDSSGQPVDYRFVEVNQVYERQTGQANPTGKLGSEVAPNTEAYWLHTYDQVATTGDPVRFENYHEGTGRWYQAYAARTGSESSDQVAIVFDDITERKNEEERQEFLLHLSDTLRPLTGSVEIQTVTARLLGEHLKADQTHYGEYIDDYINIKNGYGNEMAPMDGKLHHSDFGERQLKGFRSGKMQVSHDTAADPGLSEKEREGFQSAQIGAYIAAPLVKKGEWVALLGVHSKKPRQWKPHEIDLVQEVAERTWAAVERANAEEALQASRERLQKATQIGTVGILSFDDQNNVLQANDAFLKMSGYTAAQIARHELNLRNITPPEWIPAMEKAMQEILATGTATPYEKQLIRSDGSRWWALCAKARIGENDNVEYIIDVTTQKQAEEALHESEERYRIALNSANMAAWDWNIVKDTVQWNDQHFYLLGLEPDGKEKAAADFLNFVHVDDRDHVQKQLMDAVKSTGAYHADFRVVWRNGEVRWMSGHGRVVTYREGQAVRMAGVMLDITEHKLFTEELHRQVAERTVELQRSNEDLRQFAHVASHDLKEPVRKIKTFNSRVLEEFEAELPHKAKSYLEKVDASTDRMLSMIDGVLRYSKTGNTVLQVQQVDLNETIRQIETDLEVLIQQKEAVITTRSLPVIEGSAVLLYQLFYNLLLNSLKFARAGMPSQTQIACAPVTVGDEAFYEITVADNGIGFEAEFEKDIFKTFTRLNPVEEYEGTGLGLALCKKIVERHGGTISARGMLGEGAVFTILLPAR